MDRKLRLPLLCCALTATLAMAGCSSTATPGPGPTTAPSNSPSTSGSPSAPGTTSPSGGATGPSSPGGGGSAGPVKVTFAANGKSVVLHVGQQLHVDLATPFWTFQPVGAPKLLRTDATGVATAQASCPPPMGAAGCGDATADYTAVSAGQTSVIATRIICGEAMRCTGANGRFDLQVSVTP
ncbi:hypothetical protein ABH940_001345 [Streptacidiphilus sp. BW17]|uniref:hypothetical protein n=1 Tax=Streptacidiphilus sp. BW17 TaxID=3156274 RepID=UPI0035160B8D